MEHIRSVARLMGFSKLVAKYKLLLVSLSVVEYDLGTVIRLFSGSVSRYTRTRRQLAYTECHFSYKKSTRVIVVRSRFTAENSRGVGHTQAEIILTAVIAIFVFVLNEIIFEKQFR